MYLDVTDAAALDTEVAKNDVVVSLIPYTFHANGKLLNLESDRNWHIEVSAIRLT